MGSYLAAPAAKQCSSWLDKRLEGERADEAEECKLVAANCWWVWASRM